MVNQRVKPRSPIIVIAALVLTEIAVCIAQEAEEEVRFFVCQCKPELQDHPLLVGALGGHLRLPFREAKKEAMRRASEVSPLLQANPAVSSRRKYNSSPLQSVNASAPCTTGMHAYLCCRLISIATVRSNTAVNVLHSVCHLPRANDHRWATAAFMSESMRSSQRSKGNT